MEIDSPKNVAGAPMLKYGSPRRKRSPPARVLFEIVPFFIKTKFIRFTLKHFKLWSCLPILQKYSWARTAVWKNRWALTRLARQRCVVAKLSPDQIGLPLLLHGRAQIRLQLTPQLGTGASILYFIRLRKRILTPLRLIVYVAGRRSIWKAAIRIYAGDRFANIFMQLLLRLKGYMRCTITLRRCFWLTIRRTLHQSLVYATRLRFT